MPIVQISRIQHRRGKRTDLPQLAAGELGWVIDEQRLFIGNGTVADGAPAVGNTEIVTSGSSTFSTALTHTYKGYLGDSTPVTSTVARSLQQRLDEYVSVKDFGAKGDGDTAASIAAATDDTTAIQTAIDEIFTETDEVDSNSRRVLFFPAGKYKITAALKIPPYAHLVGEGPDKTIIRNQGNNSVMVTQDNANNVGASITALVDQIQISNMTLKNSVAYAGVSLDSATKIYFNNCRIEGSYATGGADASTSKGVTVTSTNALQSSHLYFNQCQIAKFARLVDLSYDVTNVRFNNCDFSTGYYGALIGATLDGTSNGLTVGPRDVHFSGSSWSDIGQQAIYSKNASGSVYPRNIISSANWYASTVANNFEGVGSIREVPVIQFDNDECSSVMDFFERSDLRRSDGSSELNAAPELQGIGVQTKAIKSQTLADNTSAATTINEYPALAGKGLKIVYKIVRGTTDRTGELVVSASTNGVSYDDTYTESGSDVGVELTAVLDNKDSTAGSETVALKFTTTSTGTAATIDYQTTILA
jgi:hypothetical protein